MENSNKVADKMIVEQNLNSVAYQLYILTWNFSGLLARHFIKVPNQTNDTKDNPIRFDSYCSSESQCFPPNLIRLSNVYNLQKKFMKMSIELAITTFFPKSAIINILKAIKLKTKFQVQKNNVFIITKNMLHY